MAFTPRQLSRWFAVFAGAVFALVIVFYTYARYRMQQAPRIAAQHLGGEVERNTQGFSFSKAQGGHTLYTIRAAKAVEYKEGGRAHLQNVTILIYGKNGDRFDQVSGSDFEYDPQSGEVTATGSVQIELEGNAQGPQRPDQAPPQEQANLIHIKTDGLSFNQKTGIASTDKPLEFRVPQGQGTSNGAIWDSNSGKLRLLAAVQFKSSGATPTLFTAENGQLERNPRQAVFQNVHAQEPNREVRCDNLIVYLDAKDRVQRMLASGDVEAATTPEAPAQPKYHARSATAEFLFDQQNQLRTVVARGDVKLDSSGAQGARGSAQSAQMEFGADRHMNKVHAEGDVHLAQSRPAEANAGAQDVELITDAMDLFAGSAGVLDRGITSGAARIEIQPHVPPGTAPKQGKTVVTATRFNATFDSQGRMRLLHGEPEARIVSASPVAGQPARVSTSQRLDATFSASGELDSLTQSSNVRYDDGQRQAFASEGRYTPQDALLRLSGAPRIIAQDVTTTAAHVLINRNTGDMVAEQDVKSTYNSPKSGGALLGSGSPIHVTSRTMHAAKASGIAHYVGDARLWQDSNIIQAPAIDFQRDQKLVLAQSDARQPATASLVETDGKGRQSPINVRADKLTYSDVERKVHGEGNVIVKSDQGQMNADHADMFLTPRPADKMTAAPTQVERSVAEGNVEIDQPGRTGKGEKLVYTASESRFVLTGAPGRFPLVTDSQRGTTSGEKLIFFSGDERVLVEGADGERAVSQARVKSK